MEHRYYPGISLEELKRMSKNFTQDLSSLCRDLNPGPPAHKVRVLTTHPLCLVKLIIVTGELLSKCVKDFRILH